MKESLWILPVVVLTVVVIWTVDTLLPWPVKQQVNIPLPPPKYVYNERVGFEHDFYGWACCTVISKNDDGEYTLDDCTGNKSYHGSVDLNKYYVIRGCK